MAQEIVIATTNPGKFKELSEMLDTDKVIWKSLKDFDGLVEVVEDGSTFIENARKKAIGYAQQINSWVIADDSGLMIDALNGQPGINSARFSGEKDADRGLIDHKNIQKVLRLMDGTPAQKRTARFVCALCVASPMEILLESQGVLNGFITEKKVGENGFGYDPIFWSKDKNKGIAQMTAEEKNSISHRGNAIKKLKPFLDELVARL